MSPEELSTQGLCHLKSSQHKGSMSPEELSTQGFYVPIKSSHKGLYFTEKSSLNTRV
jgi:hypothetical protein